MKRGLLLVGLAVLPFSAHGSAGAAGTSIAPSEVAWYDATYPTTTAAPPAPQPGVGAGQLLVSGMTISTSLLPLTTPGGPITRTQTTALAALRFAVPAGYSASTLTLVLAPGLSTATIDGRLPTGITPVACPATSAFTAGGQQAFDKAPRYDCSARTSVGAVSADKTAVVFADIAAVARGKDLSFVVLPGSLGAERLVFQPPTSTSLTLLSFDAPPVFSAGGVPALPPLTPPPLVPPVPQPPAVVSPPVLARQEPVLMVTGAPAPAVAAPNAVAGPLGVVARALALDDQPVRIKIVGGLVLLLAAGALLAVTDRRRAGLAEWGVGRHRAVRDGRAPAL